MTLDTFFEKFDLFADAPDAVAKMRELILRLAMQGKLVSQNPRDEPASALALKLRAEVADKSGRRTAPLPPIAYDEIPFELPAGWVWERLGNIGETNIGLTYSPNDVSDVGTPVLRSSNIQNGKLDFEDLVRVKCEPKQSVMVQDGDLLICARNGSRALVGKVALIENLKEPAAFGAFMAIFRSRVNMFLYYFICSPLFRRMIDEVNTTTINQITQNNLRSTLAPLPPLAEQKRIVAKVDELMALCDRLEAQQQEREAKASQLARASLARFADAPTPANLDYLFHSSFSIPPADLRKSILTLAVQGDLSSGTSDPAEWSTVRMEEVCDLITDGEHATPQRTSSGVPLATAKNVRDGFLDMAKTDYVAQETAEKCWKRCKPSPGDILMVCVGATTGRVCRVANPPDMVLVRSVALLRPNTRRIEGAFLDLFLRSPSGQTQIWGGVRQNAQPCLYLGKMSAFTIQLPPLAEQGRIVAKVEQLMALVDALETQLAASRTTAANLLSALVAELTAG